MDSNQVPRFLFSTSQTIVTFLLFLSKALSPYPPFALVFLAIVEDRSKSSYCWFEYFKPWLSNQSFFSILINITNLFHLLPLVDPFH